MGLSVVLVSFILSARELLYLYNFLQDWLTVSPEAYPSIAVAVSKIYNDGGIGAFYAGISPTLIGMLPYRYAPGRSTLRCKFDLVCGG